MTMKFQLIIAYLALSFIIFISTFLIFTWKASSIEGEINYDPIQITNNGYHDWLNSIDGELIVWQAGEGDIQENFEIYLYDSSTAATTQITDNNYDDRVPRAHNGLVTWLGKPDGLDYEVFLYDYETGLTLQITDNELNENYPQVHDGLITWYAWEGNNIGSSEIYLYDTSSGETIQITDNYNSDYYPRVLNGQVIWHGWAGSDSEIFLYDYATRITTRITNNDYNDDGPQIHNGIIVWRAKIDGTIQLFLYDPLSADIINIGTPVYSWGVSFHDGMVAYLGFDGENKEIFLYDYYNGGTTTQITDNEYNDIYSLSIRNGKIAFSANGGLAGDDYEIFIYDLATGGTIQITDNFLSDSNPFLSDSLLAWKGRGGAIGSDYEIFILKLPIFATVDIDPDTLNVKSNGQWITAYIELPVGYDVCDIELDSISLAIATQSFSVDLEAPTAIGDYNIDGIPDLMVKFDRTKIIGMLGASDYDSGTAEGSLIEFTITGTVKGTAFAGSDWIKVIQPGK